MARSYYRILADLQYRETSCNLSEIQLGDSSRHKRTWKHTPRGRAQALAHICSEKSKHNTWGSCKHIFVFCNEQQPDPAHVISLLSLRTLCSCTRLPQQKPGTAIRMPRKQPPRANKQKKQCKKRLGTGELRLCTCVQARPQSGRQASDALLNMLACAQSLCKHWTEYKLKTFNSKLFVHVSSMVINKEQDRVAEPFSLISNALSAIHHLSSPIAL